MIRNLVIILFVLAFILIIGCSNSQQYSGTQNIENSNGSQTGNSFFIRGDIISSPENSFGNGQLILGYDPERDNYQYVLAWKGDGGNWTFNKENYQIAVIRRDVVEKEHYKKLANILSYSTEPIPAMYQTLVTTANQNNLCDEWFACGFGFGNFQGEPAGLSPRCHELYEMRMRNDQRVMNCLKNLYEASGNNAVEKLHCIQGIGTVEECAKYGIKLDRDNGNVIN